jgi:hypothetical protein
MAVTPRDQIFLKSLHRYRRLNVPQLADLAGVKKDIARGRVHVFVEDKLIRSPDKRIYDKEDPETAAPVYALTLKGSAVLARHTNDASYILPAEPNFKDWGSVNHHRRVSGVHIRLDRAVATNPQVLLTNLTFSHDVADPKAKEASRHFVLNQRFDGGRVCAIPDSGFALHVGGLTPRAWFTELECNSKHPSEFWSRKWQGAFHMNATKRFAEIFPGTADMRTIAFLPYRDFLDTLLHSVMKTSDGEPKPGARHWLLVDVNEFNATPYEELLTKPIFWKVDKEKPVSLIPSGTP